MEHRVLIRSLRRLCVLGVSAVNPDLKLYLTTRHREKSVEMLQS
jgi:hypothetical protein